MGGAGAARARGGVDARGGVEEDSATRKIDSRGVRRFRVCRGGRSEFFSPLSGDRDERSRSGAAGEVGGDVAVPWWWRGLWMEGERWSFFFFFFFLLFFLVPDCRRLVVIDRWPKCDDGVKEYYIVLYCSLRL